MTDSSKPNSVPNEPFESKVARKAFMFEGRYSRGKFWAWSLLLPMFLFLLVIPLVSMSDPRGSDGGAILLLVMALPLLFLHAKLIVQRLHDLGRSGRWFSVFTLLPILMFIESFAIYGRIEQSYEAQQWIQPYVLFMLLGSFALFFGGFIVIGCLRGTEGPNEYGPDPRGEQKPEPAPSA
jgi:uncharacterized membrane protein YhaH (DUF805 family)